MRFCKSDLITAAVPASSFSYICVAQDNDEDEKDKGETAADGAAKTKKKKKKKKKAAEEGGAASQVTACHQIHISLLDVS